MKNGVVNDSSALSLAYPNLRQSAAATGNIVDGYDGLPPPPPTADATPKKTHRGDGAQTIAADSAERRGFVREAVNTLFGAVKPGSGAGGFANRLNRLRLSLRRGGGGAAPAEPPLVDTTGKPDSCTKGTTYDYSHYIIPDLWQLSNKNSYYCGDIDRFEAERRLAGKADGNFIVQETLGVFVTEIDMLKHLGRCFNLARLGKIKPSEGFGRKCSDIKQINH